LEGKGGTDTNSSCAAKTCQSSPVPQEEEGEKSVRMSSDMYSVSPSIWGEGLEVLKPAKTNRERVSGDRPAENTMSGTKSPNTPLHQHVLGRGCKKRPEESRVQQISRSPGRRGMRRNVSGEEFPESTVAVDRHNQARRTEHESDHQSGQLSKGGVKKLGLRWKNVSFKRRDGSPPQESPRKNTSTKHRLEKKLQNWRKRELDRLYRQAFASNGK